MKYAFIKILVVGAVISAVVAYTPSTVTYERNEATSTQVQVEGSNDVEKARKQMEDATNKLNAEETKILADTDQASSTAHAKVAEILAEYETRKAENDKKLDEINAIRSSF